MAKKKAVKKAVKKVSKSAQVRALLAEGGSNKEIAKKVGCTPTLVSVVRAEWHKKKKQEALEPNRVFVREGDEWKHVSVVTPVAAREELADALKTRIEDAQSKIKDHATRIFISPEALDMVNNPPHYKRNGIEVIDVIEAFDLNYRLGNVVKYVLRHVGKGGVEDLKKARWYLDREISKYE